MPRVKKGVHALKKRRALLKRAKGFRFGRSKKEREARTALLKAGAHALTNRRKKKRDFRALWNIQINAAVRSASGRTLSYSRFVGLLKKKNIALDRKILAGLANAEPATFERLVKQVRA